MKPYLFSNLSLVLFLYHTLKTIVISFRVFSYKLYIVSVIIWWVPPSFSRLETSPAQGLCLILPIIVSPSPAMWLHLIEISWLLNEWMDRGSLYYSYLGIRYYCMSIYGRHKERAWCAPVHLWDISKEEICGQVCLGPESPLIFKSESDADNSWSFSAFWTRCSNEFSRGSWCLWRSPAEPHLVWYPGSEGLGPGLGILWQIDWLSMLNLILKWWTSWSFAFPGGQGQGGRVIIFYLQPGFYVYPGTKLSCPEAIRLENPE